MEVKVTQADRDHRKEILKHIIESIQRPCCDGDMIDDRQEKLEIILARHRISSQAELIEALEKIARAQCTSVGCRSDDLTDSWHYLKSIARGAIAKAKGEE